MIFLGYSLALLMGLILGLLGGGGSILTVPILVYCFKVPAALATGYSLFIVGMTSLFGAYRYRGNNLLDIKTAVLFAVPSIMGVLLSRLSILPAIPPSITLLDRFVSKDQLILVAFAILIITIACFMCKSRDPDPGREEETNTENRSLLLLTVGGFFVGIITGFVGAGGGFIIVPALTLFAKIPLRKAIATSLLIISSKSIFGFAGDLFGGATFNWPFMISLLILTVSGALLGTKICKKASPKHLRKIFAYFILSMGIFIFFKEVQIADKTAIFSQTTISVSQLLDLSQTQEEFILVDVRQPREHQEMSIDGSILMPLDTLNDQIQRLDKDQRIVLYCRSGRRSGMAQKILKKEGFKSVLNLEGGIIAWDAAIKKESGNDY